jgi:hypothetical protein
MKAPRLCSNEIPSSSYLRRSIRADDEHQRSGDGLTGVLPDRIERDHRARSHIQGHRLQVHAPLDVAPSIDTLLGPEIEPDAARQVNAAEARAFLDDRRHQDVATVEIFGAARHRAGIAGVMQP